MAVVVLDKQEAKLLDKLMQKRKLTREQAIKLLIQKYAAKAASEVEQCKN